MEVLAIDRARLMCVAYDPSMQCFGFYPARKLLETQKLRRLWMSGGDDEVMGLDLNRQMMQWLTAAGVRHDQATLSEYFAGSEIYPDTSLV